MNQAAPIVMQPPAAPLRAVATPSLRLCQLVTRMDTGGVPEHVLALMTGLAQRGYRLTLICREISERYRQPLEQLGVRIVLLDLRRLIHPVADLRAAFHLYQILRQQRCQILHMHMSKAALLGGVIGALARVPVRINTAHNLGCIALPRKSLRALFWLYDRALFATTMHAVITVSARIRQSIVRLRLLPATKARAIPNGIDPAPFIAAGAQRAAVRAALGLHADDIAIGCVARLVWFKGLNTLIDALPAALGAQPNLRVLIAGAGPLQASLMEQAQSLGVAERITWLGERSDVANLLAAFDMFVLPSVSEGMPITILEAMAAGLPTIATDVGGVGEMLEHRVSGLLVPPTAPTQLTQAIVELAGDANLRQSIGAAGRARLQSHFAQEAMVDATDRLYRAQLAQARPA